MIKIQNAYTVTQVNTYIKNMFKDDRRLQSILITGEISNCSYNASTGHIFFTLKDDGANIDCVMFFGDSKRLKFRLQDGQQVNLKGRLDLYVKTGNYQVIVNQMVLAGKGDLYEKYEQLKLELEELGMFDACYKQEIPKYTQKLGVITASTGDAIRDIISVSKKRNPYVQIILYPAQVQGNGAVASIIKGIQSMQMQDVDVIIVGRGGGSIEELGAFNDREVAQAIFDCKTPIISAVGHQTDFTIADYVADLRAETPTAAANYAVFEYDVLIHTLLAYETKLEQSVKQTISKNRQWVSQWEERFKYNSPQYKIRDQRMTLSILADKFSEAMEKKLVRRKHQVAVYAEKMKGLSPLNQLERGYSYVTDNSGANIKKSTQVALGDFIQIKLSKGSLTAQVTQKGK